MTFVLAQGFDFCFFDIVSIKDILFSAGANFGPKFNKHVWWSVNATSVRLIMLGLTCVVVIGWLFLLLDVVWNSLNLPEMSLRKLLITSYDKEHHGTP